MEKLNLITKGLGEVIGLTELEQLCSSNEPFSAYWGTAPTGKIHIGYLIPMIKIAHLLKAECNVTILFADLHAYLDSMKTSWELLDLRTQYYEHVIKQLLLCLDVDISKLKFVKGSSYQLTSEYTLDVYKMLSKITVDAAQKGGAEVVKQSDNPLMSGLIYPILQILDEVYLKTDIEIGGIDQRKIFMMSRDQLYKIGYKSTIHLMNKMLPSLGPKKTNEKMSSSEPNSKIELTDSMKDVKKKINKTFLEEGNITCPLFEFIQHVIFPILELKSISHFTINRDEKWGGPLHFKDYETLTNDYLENKLSPPDIKLGVSDFINNLLEPLRLYFENENMIELIRKAYT